MPEDDCYGSEDGYSSDFDHEDEVVKRQIAASDDDAASLEDGEIPDDEHVSGPGGDAKPDVGSGRVDDSKDNGTSGDGASKPDGSIPKARTSPKWFCKIDAEGLLKIARDRDLRCTLENVEIVSDDPRALEKALSMFGENGP
ncbi:unnamed protein product [Peniophora sp. CBMAI 1063]|nr:unnamed protein product [Peniophora sp. CBMAI 1063]